MTRFRAGCLLVSRVIHSWAILDSHDTARFRSIAGSRERQLVGVGLQMTTPGVPMVFAGDEIGLEGEWGEDARRTMPWDRPGEWDAELLDGYRRLDRAPPQQRDALARGGIRYAHVSDDAIAYLRESPEEARPLPRDARRRRSLSGCRSRRSAARSSRRSSARTRRSTGDDVLLPAAGRRSMPGESHDERGEPRWLRCS